MYFDRLFAAADTAKSGALSGRDAVGFLTKSGLPRETLKTIWTTANPSGSPVLRRNDFYVAMRLVSLAQAGKPVSTATFLENMTTQLRPPMFEGLAPPPAAAPAPAVGGIGGSGAASGSGGGAPAASAAGDDKWAVTADLRAKYEALFHATDTNHDGFVEAGEAATLLQRSGLQPPQLAAIWRLSDVGRDNRLNANEFIIAMHLTVCVSKKNMALPATLPPALSAFASAAPGGTGAIGVSKSPAPARDAVPASAAMPLSSPPAGRAAVPAVSGVSTPGSATKAPAASGSLSSSAATVATSTARAPSSVAAASKPATPAVSAAAPAASAAGHSPSGSAAAPFSSPPASGTTPGISGKVSSPVFAGAASLGSLSSSGGPSSGAAARSRAGSSSGPHGTDDAYSSSGGRRPSLTRRPSGPIRRGSSKSLLNSSGGASAQSAVSAAAGEVLEASNEAFAAARAEAEEVRATADAIKQTAEELQEALQELLRRENRTLQQSRCVASPMLALRRAAL